MPFAVRTDVFEGPFDVLLRLITEQRVDVYDISLAEIVDAFLAEVEALGSLDLEVATEFLVIAAILVELKSRRLLPARDGELCLEDLALLEERDFLLARLVECRTFGAAGSRLAELEKAASRSLPRRAGPDDRFEPAEADLLEGVTAAELRNAAARALARRPPEPEKVQADHVLVDEVTVAEVVARLATFLPAAGRVSFRRLTRAAATSMEIVVHFLALLELYKQGLVELEQALSFGEMTVEWTGEGLSTESWSGGAEHLVGRLVDAEYGG